MAILILRTGNRKAQLSGLLPDVFIGIVDLGRQQLNALLELHLFLPELFAHLGQHLF